MGAKLTKSKSISISEKTKEQQKEISTIVEKPIEKKKKTKKKEEKFNKKSSQTRVDKSTNTDNYVLSSSSSCTEQLVGNQASTINNMVLLNTNTAQVNAGYQPETPNKDVQELRAACARNGIISAEFHADNSQRILNEQEDQANSPDVTEASTNNTVVTDVAKDEVQSEEQQPVNS